MQKLQKWLRGFGPPTVNVDAIERLRACVGALLGILLTGLAMYALPDSSFAVPLLLAPMGATAVLLFAVPASPLAQPWSVIGGNIVSATIGVICAQCIAEPVLGATFAIAGAIAAMFALRCLHPPSGAIALTAVLGGESIRASGFWFILDPVAVNSVLILLVAIVFNNATRRRYPHLMQIEHATTHRTADRRPSDRLGFTPDDLDDVLKQYNQVLDVSRDDLETLFLEAERHAFRRRHGDITCADIMSRDIVTVRATTALPEAWKLLRHHRIKALPVVDDAHHVIGILTLVDFMKHARLDGYETVDGRLGKLLRSVRGTGDKPRHVGQIMSTQVRAVQAGTHIVELVSQLSDEGMHHIPVIDHEHKLTGIVTQSDIIAALYRGQLIAPALAA